MLHHLPRNFLLRGYVVVCHIQQVELVTELMSLPLSPLCFPLSLPLHCPFFLSPSLLSPSSLPPLSLLSPSSLPQHLDILQAHKGNIFEVNLPNKVTKIMEVPKKGTVRDAIGPVLKKNNYSLDVMDLKFADTLKVESWWLTPFLIPQS